MEVGIILAVMQSFLLVNYLNKETFIGMQLVLMLPLEKKKSSYTAQPLVHNVVQ